MMWEHFAGRVLLENAWLCLRLAGSLPARHDAEQDVGLLQACVCWRLAEARKANKLEVWVCAELAGTLLASLGRLEFLFLHSAFD